MTRQARLTRASAMRWRLKASQSQIDRDCISAQPEAAKPTISVLKRMTFPVVPMSIQYRPCGGPDARHLP